LILVAGLGNPGHHYHWTRHNFGFLVMDFISAQRKLPFTKQKFNALYTEATLGDQDLFLIKPQTFMNLSGESIGAFAKFYRLKAEHIVILHDDVDLDFGDVRAKNRGGTAGHHGVESVRHHLDTDVFHRIRLGVGRPKDSQPIDVSDFVLSPFTAEEQNQLPPLYQQAATMLEKVVAGIKTS